MKISFLFFSVAVGVFFFCTQHNVFAASASDIFRVRSFVGVDTTAPTTPEFTSVVPVTPNQINVAWSTAVDDVILIGYRLFRDGLQIATTSQTSFTDTGLVPETLYEYTVDAYDSFANFSSSSVPVATTTLAVPVVPATTTPTTTSSETSTRVTRLDSFTITPSLHDAHVQWQTNTNTRYTLSWGRTLSYELGTISTNVFKQAHETTITNLEPGTKYWYQLDVTNGNGFTSTVKSGDFVTVSALDSSLLPNVRNITVTVDDTDVSLAWQNPTLAPGEKIRVVRSHLFYPQNATDGALVYEGVGSSITDIQALALRSPQYYTIFVLDESGAISSGAIAFASKAGAVTPTGTTTGTPSPISPATSTESGDVRILRADSVFIRQGTVTQIIANPVTLDYDNVYTIYIPRDAVASHLKSIVVSIQDPTDERLVTTYLLKLNPLGDAYEAVIEPPHVVGSVRLMIEVYDFYFASVRRVSATVTFVPPTIATEVFPEGVVRYSELLLWPVVALITCGALIWFVVRRRRQREDNQ